MQSNNMNNPSASPFVLCAELVGHERDVRAVCALSSGALVSSSRDNTLRVWENATGSGALNCAPAFFSPSSSYCRPLGSRARASSQEWTCTATLVGHEHYVGPVVELPDGTVASGDYNGVILVWSLATRTVQLTLLGHEAAVVALGVAADGALLSGSWDSTVRVWRDGQVAQVLRGHKEAVWGVAGAPNGDVWSGSADKTIKLWRGGSCVRTLTGAADVVRQLRVVSGVGMVSGCNDGVARLYSFEGDVLRALHGHTAYVYVAAALDVAAGELVTCGEDCTVRTWDAAGNETQQLQLPSTVWDVTVLRNGDLAAACADGITRIFTRAAERRASAEALAAFEQRLKAAAEEMAKAVAANQAGGGGGGKPDLSSFPDRDALQVPGTKEGQIKVVRSADGTEAEAFSWTGGKWKFEGVVVGSKSGPPARGGDPTKELHFDVDLNGQKMVISMNRDDNVFETARQFIADNDLPEEFIDQIVEHLHRVVPDRGVHRNPDPFTGGTEPEPELRGGRGRAPGGAGADVAAYNPSPWADHAAAPSPAKKAVTPPPAFFPKAVYVLFDAPGNLAGLYKKAAEWGADAAALQALVAKHRAGVVAGAELAPLRLMLAWPAEQRFAALDVLRLLALNSSASDVVAKDAAMWKVALAAGLASEAPAPCPMLALRWLCNW